MYFYHVTLAEPTRTALGAHALLVLTFSDFDNRRFHHAGSRLDCQRPSIKSKHFNYIYFATDKHHQENPGMRLPGPFDGGIMPALIP